MGDFCCDLYAEDWKLRDGTNVWLLTAYVARLVR